jgi:chromosome partitioning protein
MKKVNEDLRLEGLLLTMYDGGNATSGDVEARVREKYGLLVYDVRIAREDIVGEAASKGMPVVHYMRGSEASKAYMKLAQEVSSDGR